MSNEVYANGNSVSCKAGDGKVIASLPDVCLSPPPPPAGPVPIPYPDTSFSKDMQNGSKTVQIGDQETMLKDQSFFNTSPLGDEAATNGLGANVVTHVITGKTYFAAWSMDVQFEGANVDRNLDIATSNHAGPQPGGGPPLPEAEKVGKGDDPKDEKCPCCGGQKHTEAQKSGKNEMTQTQYYNPDFKANPPNARQRKAFANANFVIEAAKADGCKVVHTDESDPCAKHYAASADDNKNSTEEYKAMMSPLTPAEYFPKKYGKKMGKKVKRRGQQMNKALKKGAKSISHRTARSAGGCPIGAGNLAPAEPPCDAHEELLGQTQGDIAEYHRRVCGL